MKKQPPSLRFLLFALAFCLLLPLTAVFPASAQTENQFFIADLDCSVGTTISLLVRGLNSSGNLLDPGLISGSFTIFENGQPVPSEKVEDVGAENAPKYVIFAFDRGPTSNLEDFRLDIENALGEFSTDYFKEGEDTVQFVEVTSEGASPSAPISSLSDFDNAMDNLNLDPSGDRIDRFSHLENFFNNLTETDLKAGRYSMVMIYFTRVVERDLAQASQQASSLGTRLASKNITVHVVNTDASGDANQDERQPFEDLASANGGNYLPLDSASFFPQEGVTGLFKSIAQNSQAFRVQFPAQALNATYAIAPVGFGAAEAIEDKACTDQTPPPAPEVQITKPKGENPVVDLLTADQTTIPVEAALQNSLEDGSQRIVKVELLVGEEVVDTKQLPVDSTGTTFSFDWDVSLLNIVDSETVNLRVRVTNQFGVTGTSPDSQVTVNAFVPPTAIPTPRPPFDGGVTDTCIATPFTVSCILQWLRAYLTPIILVVLLIVIIVLFNTNRKLASFASSGREAVSKGLSKGLEQVRKTLLGGTSIRRESIATLHVIVARADRTGGRIEIYNNRTTLGRDPKLTDVQLFYLDDESSVSGLHCTIFYDQGKFFITDDNSSNGTFLNNKRLSPNDPTELPDGAEIILGDIYRQGAKLRFEIATGGTEPIDAYPVEEPDFHFDLPADGGPGLYSPPPKAAGPKAGGPNAGVVESVDDHRKTVPGYRDDGDEYIQTDAIDRTDVFNEPPLSPPPVPGPPFSAPPPKPAAPPPAPPRKKQDDDWKKKLG